MFRLKNDPLVGPPYPDIRAGRRNDGLVLVKEADEDNAKATLGGLTRENVVGPMHIAQSCASRGARFCRIRYVKPFRK